jgi:hypothetical protein
MSLNIREVKTIQTKNKLNYICSCDDRGHGNANHHYRIIDADKNVILGDIKFQDGPRYDLRSHKGIIDSDLLEIVRDRLISFQSSEYANEYNEEALAHIEAALECLNKRLEDRLERNVLGTLEK